MLTQLRDLGLVVVLFSARLAFGQDANASPVASSTTASVLTATIAGDPVTYSPQFTVPATADQGANLIPNIQDPNATDAQTVCPGYTASNLVNNTNGFSAMLTLAGRPCKYAILMPELVDKDIG